jgi:hypothetical protein
VLQILIFIYIWAKLKEFDFSRSENDTYLGTKEVGFFFC